MTITLNEAIKELKNIENLKSQVNNYFFGKE